MITQQFKHKIAEPLYVIGVVSNAARYHSRIRLAREWVKRMEATAGVKVYLVETAYGDNHHEIAHHDNPCHLQLRTKTNAWVKESMINLGVRMLPRNWKYMAWIDMDVEFRNPDWAQQTIQELQHFAIVQPWANCVDLGPHGSILKTHHSFGYLHASGIPKQRNHTEPYAYGHTGYAWACTRTLWESVGGLPDFCILGSADSHAAWAAIGDAKPTIHGRMSHSYFRRIHEWQIRAMRITHGHVGFVPGRIEHSWHGSKKQRQYRERWQILVDHGYCPDMDLMYDEQGLVKLTGKHGLEAAIHQYNVSRQEDSVDE
jgi:hypothetical protein